MLKRRGCSLVIWIFIVLLVVSLLLRACKSDGPLTVSRGQEHALVIHLDRYEIRNADMELYWDAAAQRLFLKEFPHVQMINYQESTLVVDLPERRVQKLPTSTITFKPDEFIVLNRLNSPNKELNWRSAWIYSSEAKQGRHALIRDWGIVLEIPKYRIGFMWGGDTGWYLEPAFFGKRVLTIYPEESDLLLIQLAGYLFNSEYRLGPTLGTMGWLPGGRYFLIVQEPYGDNRILILDAGEPTNNVQDNTQ